MSTSFFFRLLVIQGLAVMVLMGQNRFEPQYLKTEVFGGFSTVNHEPGRLSGWAVGVTNYQWFRRWGLTAEFAGRSRDRDGLKVDGQTYLFGGTFRAREWKRLALTGRVVAGVDRWDPQRVVSGGFVKQNSFVFGFGQAIDLKVNEHVAVRVRPELMFVRRKEKTDFVNPFSVGLVVKFGKR